MLLSAIKNEVRLVVEAIQSYEFHDRRKVIAQNKKFSVQHAYFNEYKYLQRLCLLILQYRQYQLGIGARKIEGILFDGAWSWEVYVSSLIATEFYHPRNKNGEGVRQLFTNDFGSKEGLIYPDFIGTNPDEHVIADAKYKPSENIYGRDYLQVPAYMFRFDAKRGYYLYPRAIGDEDQLLKLNRGVTVGKELNQGIVDESPVQPRGDVEVRKLGLAIPPESGSFSDFEQQMELSERQFRDKFIGQLDQ